MERFVLREVTTEYGSEYKELVDTKTGEVVGTDGGEPEDNTFYRDWAWVPTLLNKVANGG